jgi:hypothetical protein
MRNFIKTVDIEAPPQQVWDVMIDVERWHEWTRSITTIKRLDSGPFVVGSRARVLQPKLRPAIWIVTQLENGRSFTWEAPMPGLRIIGYHGVEMIEHGSRVTLSVRLEGPIGGLVGWLYRKVNAEYLGLEAGGLKRRSEGKC